MTCYIPRWFTRPQTVTHPSTNRAQCRLTTLIEANALTTTLCRQRCPIAVRRCTTNSHKGPLTFKLLLENSKKFSLERGTSLQTPNPVGRGTPSPHRPPCSFWITHTLSLLEYDAYTGMQKLRHRNWLKWT